MAETDKEKEARLLAFQEVVNVRIMSRKLEKEQFEAHCKQFPNDTLTPFLVFQISKEMETLRQMEWDLHYHGLEGWAACELMDELGEYGTLNEEERGGAK